MKELRAVEHESKTCSVCGVTRCLADFYRDTSRPDGHHHRCKSCQKAYALRHQQANPVKAEGYRRKTYERQQARRSTRRNLRDAVRVAVRNDKNLPVYLRQLADNLILSEGACP